MYTNHYNEILLALLLLDCCDSYDSCIAHITLFHIEHVLLALLRQVKKESANMMFNPFEFEYVIISLYRIKVCLVLSDFIAFKLYIDLTHANCANILAILISTMRGQGLDKLNYTFPKGIWLRFDFDDSHPVSITAHFSLLFESKYLPIINTLCSLFFFLLFFEHGRICQLYICKVDQLYLWVLLISMLVKPVLQMT